MVEEKVYRLLLEKNLTLATAESCSGGLLAHRLTNVPGVSKVFLLGVVSYSNDAKIKVLGVDAGIIEAQGAVCAEVACQMADGVRRAAGSDVGIGITGIAGPTGGSPEKPVGTVYMGISYPDMRLTEARHFRFGGNRTSVKEQTVATVLRWLCEILEKS